MNLRLSKMTHGQNKALDELVIASLHQQYKRNCCKSTACELNINLCTVRNWVYKGTKIEGFELLLILKHYPKIRRKVIKWLNEVDKCLCQKTFCFDFF